MSRLVKIVDNKYVQIEEYRNPNICFNTNEYDDYEDYCTLRETFDPFEMFYENKELKEQVDYLRRSIERKEETIIDLQNERVPYTNKYVAKLENQQKEFIKYLENMLDNENDIFSVVRVKDVLSKYKEIIGVSNE